MQYVVLMERAEIRKRMLTHSKLMYFNEACLCSNFYFQECTIKPHLLTMAASNILQTFQILLVDQSSNHFHQEHFAMTPSVHFLKHQIPGCISVKYIDMLLGAKNI